MRISLSSIIGELELCLGLQASRTRTSITISKRGCLKGEHFLQSFTAVTFELLSLLFFV